MQTQVQVPDEPVTTNLAQVSYVTPGGASADPQSIYLTLDASGTEALHPKGAALKAMPRSLGNSRSINTFIFVFLMAIKKISNANILHT